MGQDAVTRIDIAALRVVAEQFDASAEILAAAARGHLGALAFDGASAGRDHVAHGDALRRALDRLAGEMAQWSRASAEIAAALRASADRYADAELCGAARIA